MALSGIFSQLHKKAAGTVSKSYAWGACIFCENELQ